MRWVIIGKTVNDEMLVGRIDDDGLMRVNGLATNDEYLAWVAEGNTAEEWVPNAD